MNLRLLLLVSLSLVGCHQRRASAPGAGPTALSAGELSFIEAQPGDHPFDMVLDDTAQGNTQLHVPSLLVTVDSPGLGRLEARMRATLEREQGVGLAGPQVGVQRRVVLVQRLDKPDEPVEWYLNPAITEYGAAEELGWEGCLSVPAGFGQVERSVAIRVAYDLSDGQRVEEPVQGWTARIFQHELDHLDGVLFRDRTVTGALTPEAEYRSMRERERREAEASQPPEPFDTGAP